MDNPSQAITALTSLIHVNNKRMKTYQSLAGKATHEEFRALLSQWAHQSKLFSRTLSTWRAAYGGFASSETTPGISDVWSQVKSIFDAHRKKDVVTLCKDIERNSLKAYKTTMEASVLPTAAAVD